MAYRKTGKLGNCARCFTNRPAVTEQVVALGPNKYRLRLCDECADGVVDQFSEWARLGTLLDDDDQATFKAAPRRRRGTGQVLRRGGPQLELPTISAVVIHDEPEEEVQPQRTVHPRRTAEPPNGDRWIWGKHATERFNERTRFAEQLGFNPLTKADVLWCIEHPELTRPGDDEKYPGCTIHQRGHVHVVVNPDADEIVTIKDRRITLEQELELQSV